MCPWAFSFEGNRNTNPVSAKKARDRVQSRWTGIDGCDGIIYYTGAEGDGPYSCSACSNRFYYKELSTRPSEQNKKAYDREIDYQEAVKADYTKASALIYW